MFVKFYDFLIFADFFKKHFGCNRLCMLQVIFCLFVCLFLSFFLSFFLFNLFLFCFLLFFFAFYDKKKKQQKQQKNQNWITRNKNFVIIFFFLFFCVQTICWYKFWGEFIESLFLLNNKLFCFVSVLVFNQWVYILFFFFFFFCEKYLFYT